VPSAAFNGPELEPLKLREITVSNRVWMSPMAQYAAGPDGVPTNWHFAHYGGRAVGGMGLMMVEGTAIGPTHRTTSADLGIWSEEQVAAHRRLTGFIAEHGPVPAIQLNAPGRKGSHKLLWEGAGQNAAVSVADGGWDLVAPSAIPFGDLAVPREASPADLDELVETYVRAARNAHEAGYQVLELIAGHGYLLHQFLSPLSNHRTDEYGGSLDNRMRFPLRVARAVREAFPPEKALCIRITATDYVEGGITIEEASKFAKELAAVGVDLLDVTSGLVVRDREARPPAWDGINVDFASTLRTASGLAVAPSWQINDLARSREVIGSGKADAVLIGRPFLRDPYFALRERMTDKDAWPVRYHRAL
jgi:2,4-dienoyl-CoA reductase-like NADH-dependent reductase (Old Yellow Enzyme family)